jgi:hypothetical protein
VLVVLFKLKKQPPSTASDSLPNDIREQVQTFEEKAKKEIEDSLKTVPGELLFSPSMMSMGGSVITKFLSRSTLTDAIQRTRATREGQGVYLRLVDWMPHRPKYTSLCYRRLHWSLQGSRCFTCIRYQ